MSASTKQRREEIMTLLQASGKVRVTELGEKFGISEVTVRADLEALEKAGRLNRTHGGAVLLNALRGGLTLHERYETNSEAKMDLAKKVAELIEDNDTIMMNGGTTLTYVFHALAGKKNINIVTNSIPIAYESLQNPDIHVVLLGGQVDAKYQFTYGSDAVKQLENYHVGKCILSVDGISAGCGLSVFYANEVPIIQKIVEQSDTVIVAADATKLGKSAFHKVTPIEDVDILATNKTDRGEAEELRKLGIQVLEG